MQYIQKKNKLDNIGIETFYSGNPQIKSNDNSIIILEYFIKNISSLIIDLSYEFPANSFKGIEKESIRVFAIDFNRMLSIQDQHQKDYLDKSHLLKDYENYHSNCPKEFKHKYISILELIKDLNPESFRLWCFEYIIQITKANNGNSNSVLKDVEVYFYYCHPKMLINILELIIDKEIIKSDECKKVINQETSKLEYLEKIFKSVYYTRSNIIKKLMNNIK